jgi:hypothetical protein
MLAAPAAPSLPVPDTVPLTFGSDPDGALVVDADGTAVGHTPLSIRVPRSEQPARYRFEMLGFVTKEMESIPNVASSMFARLEPAAQRSSAASTARERRARAAARFQRSLDEDGVMPPAFGR